MARLNKPGHRVKPAIATVTSPLGTVSEKADTRTFEGGDGWSRTPKAELFLRATGAFHGGESSFYESADQRDDRLRELVRQVAIEDPDWGFEFARWLRSRGNILTGALMFAVDFVKARLDAGQHGCVGFRVPHPDSAQDVGSNRRIIDVVCQRADEPGEIIAIWSAWYGRNLPMPVKRGVADAVRRLHNQRSLLKYDTNAYAYRFGDVYNLAHPTPGDAWQGVLFEHALDRRYGRVTSTQGIPPTLDVVMRNAALRSYGESDLWLNSNYLRSAGMTWEDTLSAMGSKISKAKLWEAMIPSMGLMALLRNLRNFDQAGVSDKVAFEVVERLIDPEQIAASRQFPFRFLAAYRSTKDSLRWAWALEQALNHSLVNVPRLGGRTLILVDRSPSMFPMNGFYTAKREDEMSRADQAAVFGSALALRAEAPTLVEFGGNSQVVDFAPRTSVLRLVEKFGKIDYTDIPNAVRQHYAGHDRVVIITDEQTRAGYLTPDPRRFYGVREEVQINDLVPQHVPVFIWNFEGYTASAMPSGSEARFQLGGLTDQAFRLIPILESGKDGVWPWELDRQGA